MEEGNSNGNTRYSSEDLAHFKGILLDKRQQVLNHLEQMQSITGETDIEQNGGNLYTDSMADQGTDANEREKTFSFIHRDRKHLNEIDGAILRIKNGTYGICEVTGKLIPKDRLEAVPTTKKCIEAKNLQPS